MGTDRQGGSRFQPDHGFLPGGPEAPIRSEDSAPLPTIMRIAPGPVPPRPDPAHRGRDRGHQGAAPSSQVRVRALPARRRLRRPGLHGAAGQPAPAAPRPPSRTGLARLPDREPPGSGRPGAAMPRRRTTGAIRIEGGSLGGRGPESALKTACWSETQSQRDMPGGRGRRPAPGRGPYARSVTVLPSPGTAASRQGVGPIPATSAATRAAPHREGAGALPLLCLSASTSRDGAAPRCPAHRR